MATAMASGVFTGAKSAFGAVRDVQGDQAQRPLILCGEKDVLEPVRAILAEGAAAGQPGAADLRAAPAADRTTESSSPRPGPSSTAAGS